MLDVQAVPLWRHCRCKPPEIYDRISADARLKASSTAKTPFAENSPPAQDLLRCCTVQQLPGATRQPKSHPHLRLSAIVLASRTQASLTCGLISSAVETQPHLTPAACSLSVLPTCPIRAVIRPTHYAPEHESAAISRLLGRRVQAQGKNACLSPCSLTA